MRDASFPHMIWRIANKYHRGVMQHMALHSGLDNATLRKWVLGLTRQPDTPLLERLCETYHLDFSEVYELVRRDMRRHQFGERVPVPDLSHVKPGPQARRPLARIGGGRRRKARVA
jgi:hypothetical protein